MLRLRLLPATAEATGTLTNAGAREATIRLRGIIPSKKPVSPLHELRLLFGAGREDGTS